MPLEKFRVLNSKRTPLRPVSIRPFSFCLTLLANTSKTETSSRLSDDDPKAMKIANICLYFASMETKYNCRYIEW